MIPLTRVTLKSGASFDFGPLTVVVGPNNVGKTRLLSELESFFRGEQREYRILDEVDSTPADMWEILKELGLKVTEKPDGGMTVNSERARSRLPSVGSNKDTFSNIAAHVQQVGPTKVRQFLELFGRAVTTRVITEDRLVATKRIEYHGVSDQSLLRQFYEWGTSLDTFVSDHVSNVFGVRTKLDFSNPGVFCVRVGPDFSSIPDDPRDALPLMEKCELLDDQGDGLRAFVTTILLTKLSDRPVILLDEPEAFLHPPQALELGRILAGLASLNGKIVCATHSVDVLRGILSARTDISILRLSRRDNDTSGQPLDAKSVAKIALDPVLASSRVLDGLFYAGVVITEADSDQALYQRVALTYFRGDEVHYTHAHNKQTIHKLIEPYRAAGVAFAAIVDFDILRNSTEFRALVSSAGIQDINRAIALQQTIQVEVDAFPVLRREATVIAGLTAICSGITPSADDTAADAQLTALWRNTKRIFDAADAWATAKKLGRASLSGPSQLAFDQLDKLCRAAGIFIVPIGDLEGWLESQSYQRRANKAEWITGALAWLHTNRICQGVPLYDFISDVHQRVSPSKPEPIDQVANETTL
jgi:ABC-type cobalamin/Fe3+-siderophores transport system ATPase subunit